MERVFDLARSINLHKLSANGTKEEAIAGTTSGAPMTVKGEGPLSENGFH